jgi:hypothetical protein
MVSKLYAICLFLSLTKPEPMQGMSEDEGDADEEPAVKVDEEKNEAARKAREDRAERLRKMMEDDGESFRVHRIALLTCSQTKKCPTRQPQQTRSLPPPQQLQQIPLSQLKVSPLSPWRTAADAVVDE